MSSRAVIRLAEPGNTQDCTGCDEKVMFRARQKCKRIVANVYEGDRWVRVEHWHPECYDEAGQPYGEPTLAPTRVATG